MNAETLKNLVGSFCWNYSNKFFIETDMGNFVWSDPDYHGDNTMKMYNGTYQEWLKEQGIPYCRDKGNHIIGNYCKNFIFVES